MRTLIQYRTTEIEHSQFVVIPDIYVSDMIQWLSDHECAEIVRTETTDNSYRFPTNWPSYETCMKYVVTRTLLTETR